MSYLLFIIFNTEKRESMATKKRKIYCFYNLFFIAFLRIKGGCLSFFRQKKAIFLKRWLF